MPPKVKKPAAERSEEVVDDAESLYSGGSVASTATLASTVTVTSEQLERILAASQAANERAMAASMAANHKAMAELIATLPTSSTPSSQAARQPQIRVPKWSEEDTPFEYFTKYEKAQKHNGVPRDSWGELLPVYLSGRAQASFT